MPKKTQNFWFKNTQRYWNLKKKPKKFLNGGTKHKKIIWKIL